MMTVQMLNERLNYEIVAGASGLIKEVQDGYVGDLLSIVMAHAKEKSAWVTVQGHVNSVAVAVLVNLSVIILSQGILPDEEMRKKADEEGIPILITTHSSFEVAKRLGSILEARA